MMISSQLALRLKAAGLVWRFAEGDSFAVFDQEQNTQIFVLTQLAAHVQLINGYPVIAFHGSTEWAMDHVLTDEVVWVLSETQAREELERRLEALGDPGLRLQRMPERYHCTITVGDSELLFAAEDASDAYGLALLYLLDGTTTEL